MMRSTVVTLGALLLVLPGGAARAVEPVAVFGSNPGNLKMYQHVPASASSPLAVVTVLHGCSQAAASYAQDTGWVGLADQLGFALVLPEQQLINNVNLCFNWYQDSDITRDQGEAESIHQMLLQFSATHAVDPGRVFVAGVSSGGAMAGVMLATYPELFSAGALFAGVPYHCSSSIADALTCMSLGKTQTAAQWGDLVRAASAHAGPWPRVSIWHGTVDHTVAPANADAEVLQWTNVHGVSATPTSTETRGVDSIQRYADPAQAVAVEEHLLGGMDHGTPVDPGTGEQACGIAGLYILDVNICSAREVARFFGLNAVPPLDAGVEPDAAVQVPDAAMPRVDAGATQSSSDAGESGVVPACDCNTSGGPAPAMAALLALVLWCCFRRCRAG